MTTETEPIDEHDCPMCGGAVTGFCRSGSWRNKDGSGGMWFDAICENCDIDFRLTAGNGSRGSWRILAPDKTSLTEMISDEDIELLNQKLLRYKILGQKWREFTSKCRSRDQMWRYNREGGGTAIAIVRNGTPIAEFRTFTDL